MKQRMKKTNDDYDASGGHELDVGTAKVAEAKR